MSYYYIETNDKQQVVKLHQKPFALELLPDRTFFVNQLIADEIKKNPGKIFFYKNDELVLEENRTAFLNEYEELFNDLCSKTISDGLLFDGYRFSCGLIDQHNYHAFKLAGFGVYRTQEGAYYEFNQESIRRFFNAYLEHVQENLKRNWIFKERLKNVPNRPNAELLYQEYLNSLSG